MLVDVTLSGSPVLVDQAPDDHVLDLVRDAEEGARRADLRKVVLAVHWAERHSVSDVLDAAHWCEADPRDVEETIGGEGTPLVASSCVAELAGALGVSARAAMQLMSDGLDLRYRLPRTDQAMQELKVTPWRARRIAALTHRLSREAAAYVDERVAPIADSCGVARIERLVAEAIARFDPVEQAEVEDEAEASWGVRMEDYSGPVWTGTSRLEVVGDTPTVRQFYDLVCADARAQLDPAVPAEEQPSLEHRKVAALGRIAEGAGASRATRLYVHVDAADLLDPIQRLGEVERLGPLTVGRIQQWLTGAGRVTVQPVLDPGRPGAVDQHDPPAWMRELVILRDRRCVHPYCDRPARDCDLDHIEAYVEMDDGGPPGQTRPDNLAPLCRPHHRAKTFYGWTYVRNPDGSYTWTSPSGHRYTVDTRGVVTRHA